MCGALAVSVGACLGQAALAEEEDEVVVTSEDQYEVVVVRFGTVTMPRSRLFLNDFMYGEPDVDYPLDYYLWIARNAQRTIVIDTGFAADVALRRGRQMLVDPLGALTQLGAGPSASPDVVITHMHYDHIGNVAAFAGSRFVMARAEFEFWISSKATEQQFAHLIEPVEVEALARAYSQGRVELVDVEGELYPGITLIPVGGHTAGQLMVLVRTSEGPVLLTSDAVHVAEEYEERRPFIHMDHLTASYAAYDRINVLANDPTSARIVYGHDAAEFDRLGERFDPMLPEFSRVIGG